MKLVDTHAHIEDFEDIEDVLARARNKGVVAVVAVGSSSKANVKILTLAAKYSGRVYPAVGIHPLESRGQLEGTVKLVEDNADKCVAIGEIGLDYKYNIERSCQKEIFERMLAIASRHDKPVLLHSRGAWEDVLCCVQAYEIRKVVFHWYSGPLETLDKILDNGYFISATPAVEYSEKHREAIQRTPVEFLLLETDTPVRYRGVPSEPSDTFKVLNAVARIKDIDRDRIAEATTKSACNLFGITC